MDEPKQPDQQTPQRTSRRNQQAGLAACALVLLAILVFLIVKLIQGPPDVTAGMKHPPRAAVETLSPAAAPSEEAEKTEPAQTEGTQAASTAAPPAADAPSETGSATIQLRTFPADNLTQRLLLPLTLAESWLKTEDRLYFEEPAADKRVPDVTVDLMCLGDNLMHSTVLKAGENGDGTYDFHNLYRYIRDEVQATDLACINQETIFINDPKEYTNYPIFGGPVDVGAALADTGFDIITQATNHCYDKFSRGAEAYDAFAQEFMKKNEV